MKSKTIQSAAMALGALFIALYPALASFPSDPAVSEERYPGQYHHVTAGGSVEDFIFLNGQKIGTLKDGNELLFTIEDHLGSSALITTATGTVAEYSDYKPFGPQALGQIPINMGNDYLFTGKEVDGQTGLQYFGARYLSNGFSRFNSIDPLLLDPERLHRKLIDPQRLNGYSYSLNNPLKYVDPDGNNPLLIIGAIAIGGALFGNIHPAQAPASQSAIQPTPPQPKNLGELYIPGYESTPQWARMTLAVGAMSIVSQTKGQNLADGAISLIESNAAKVPFTLAKDYGAKLNKQILGLNAKFVDEGYQFTEHALKRLVEREPRGITFENVMDAIKTGQKLFDTKRGNFSFFKTRMV